MLSPGLLMLIGFAAGGLLGLLLRSKKIGCASLTVIPLAGFAYVSWWQSQNVESLRSTSGLDYMFGPPLPLTIGGLAGYGLVALVKAARQR